MKNEETGSIPYEKSNNVETSLFLTQGRITRKAFVLRILLCTLIWLAFHAVYCFWFQPEYQKYKDKGGGIIQEGARIVETRYNIYKTIDFYVIPSLLAVFLLIQAIKRVHDTNFNGWYLLLPIFNIYLLFSKGTDSDNDFGLLPHAEKKSPTYKTNDEN